MVKKSNSSGVGTSEGEVDNEWFVMEQTILFKIGAYLFCHKKNVEGYKELSHFG